jgi:putative sulfotransferase
MAAHPRVLSLSEFFSAVGGPALLGHEPLSGRELFSILSAPNADTEALRSRVAIPELLAPDAAPGAPAIELVTLPHLTREPRALLGDLRRFLEGVPRDGAVAQLTRVFDWFRARLERDIWVERSGASIEYGRALVRAWPNSGYVFLLRDGVDTALSMSRHPLFRLRVARLFHGPELPAERSLEVDVPLEQFGLYWSASMAEAWRCFSLVPAGRRLVVRYEDLVSKPAPSMAALSDFLRQDAAYVAEWKDRARDLCRSPLPRNELSPGVAHRLMRACVPGTRALEKILAAFRSEREQAA